MQFIKPAKIKIGYTHECAEHLYLPCILQNLVKEKAGRKIDLKLWKNEHKTLNFWQITVPVMIIYKSYSSRLVEDNGWYSSQS